MADNLPELAARVVAVCSANRIQLVLAESLTGGMAASALVAVPGASAVLLAGIIAYHDSAKHQLLGVPAVTLATFGAVSEQCAMSMAEGARQQLVNVPDIATERVIGLSTTGVAGPDSQEGKPVGQVHIALANAGGTTAKSLSLTGPRSEIREQACVCLFQLLLEQLAG